MLPTPYFFLLEVPPINGGNPINIPSLDPLEEGAMGRGESEAVVEWNSTTLIRNLSLQDPSSFKRSPHGALRVFEAGAKPTISAFYLLTEIGAVHTKLAP